MGVMALIDELLQPHILAHGMRMQMQMLCNLSAPTDPLPKADAPADTSPVANDAVYSRSQVCAVEACGNVTQELVALPLLTD